MDLARRSVEVILAGQSPAGGYVACPDFEQYRYSWFRDGSFIADAMREIGQVENADRFFDWCAHAILSRPTGPWDARYTLDGEPDPSKWPKLQIDGLGLFLGALRRRGGSARWDEAAALVARWLEHHWTEPSVDRWEEREGIHGATLWCVGNGLDSDEIRREALARAGDRLDGSLLFIGSRTSITDASPTPGRASPGSRPTRRRTAICPSSPRITSCARNGTSPGSRSGASPRRRCSGHMRCTFDCIMRCAIVGSGLAAFATYATLRHGGLPAEEIVVFGTHEDPTEVWRTRAAAIRQQRMRSESDGHLAPAAFPGLAVREAARRMSPAPLLRSVANRYHPSVDDFLAHAESLRRRTGWERSFRLQRVEQIRAVDGGFTLDCEGPFAHVLIATGHPGLARPDAFPGAVHAYEPHDYASKVAIVGAGMAAATEWLNALAAGAEVVSIRRREPLRRPLNVPRPFFSKRGLAAFHAATTERRAATLRELSTPSYPAGAAWDEPVRAAERDGRFRVDASPNGSEQVIAATGFRHGFRHDPLLADLVEAHELPTHDRWLVLDPDSTVAALTDETRTLSVAGVAAQWAFPAADTIAGAKYAAHAFRRRACRTR